MFIGFIKAFDSMDRQKLMPKNVLNIASYKCERETFTLQMRIAIGH